MRKIILLAFCMMIGCCACAHSQQEKPDNENDMLSTTDATMDSNVVSESPKIIAVPLSRSVPKIILEEYRDSVPRDGWTGGFGSVDIGHITGTYIDIFETTNGITAMTIDGRIMNIRADHGHAAVQEVCNLLEDASTEQNEQASYADAYQTGDLLYFMKNYILYECNLLDGSIRSVYHLKEDYAEEISASAEAGVIGGTCDGVLMFVGSEANSHDQFNNLLWNPENQEVKDLGQMGLNYFSGYLGCSDHVAFFTDGMQIYAVNTEDCTKKSLCDSGNACSNDEKRPISDTTPMLYGNYGAIIGNELYYLSPNLYTDAQNGNPLWLNVLFHIPLVGVEKNTQIQGIKFPADREEEIESFYYNQNECYVLVSHFDSDYSKAEQGMIIYKVDWESEDFIPVTSVLQELYYPGQMVVRDGIAYIICRDGSEVYIAELH